MVAKLRELAATGIRTYEIADIMRLPRGAICGKARREGIPLLAKAHGVSPGSARPDPNRLAPVEERIGVGRAVLALMPNHCKWPMGSPTEEDFHFCSAPRVDMSRPYCAKHTASSMSNRA
jgi:GcrA cell cycle regulator